MYWILGVLFFFAGPVFAESPDIDLLVFPRAGLVAEAQWVKGPGVSSESQMRLVWREVNTGKVVDPHLQFAVVLWMPSMDHGSAPTQIRRAVNAANEVIVGTYLVTKMFFIMPRDWEVVVKLRHLDGSEEAAKILLNIAGAGSGAGGHHHH